MGAALHDLVVVDDADDVCVLDRGEAVGDDEDSAALSRATSLPPDKPVADGWRRVEDPSVP